MFEKHILSRKPISNSSFKTTNIYSWSKKKEFIANEFKQSKKKYPSKNKYFKKKHQRMIQTHNGFESIGSSEL